ncbi:MAG: hypothetical protein KDK76_04620 [Chlamydiia bacterium]|nr:hypothetical protein [Chlamydiia bacterium]
MRKFFFWQILVATLFANVYGAVQGAYYNHFAIELDYVFMRRSNSHNKHMVAAAAGPPDALPIADVPVDCRKALGAPLMESRDLIHDMHFNTGFSAALKIFPSIRSTWEGRYLGGLSWRGQRARNCFANMNIDGNITQSTVDYHFASRVKSVYLSKLYTYELNYWHHVTPRYTDHFSASWIVGLRHFDIDEKVKMYFTRAFPFGPQTSRYRLRTENNAFGLQLGGCLEYNPYHFLSWGLVAKIGGLFNRDKLRTLMLDNGNTVVVRDVDKSGSNFGYMAQVYPFLELRPTKHFFIVVNYQALYVGRVATADRNMIFHGDFALLNHDGHIIYHGGAGGIQFNF